MLYRIDPQSISKRDGRTFADTLEPLMRTGFSSEDAQGLIDISLFTPPVAAPAEEQALELAGLQEDVRELRKDLDHEKNERLRYSDAYDRVRGERDAVHAVLEQIRKLRPGNFGSGAYAYDGAELDKVLAASPADALDLVKREAAAVEMETVARGYWGVDGDPDYTTTSGTVRRVLNKRATSTRNLASVAATNG